MDLVLGRDLNNPRLLCNDNNVLVQGVLLCVNFLTVFLLYIMVYYSNLIIYSVILLYIQ